MAVNNILLQSKPSEAIINLFPKKTESNEIKTKFLRNSHNSCFFKIMNSAEKQIYRFADVEVNTSQNCLKRGDSEQHLRQKAFSVLVHLLEQRQRLVTKEELMDVIWKDIAVTDDALVQCIKEIRRSIGDDSHHPRFIKTFPKSGYRFIGAVEEPVSDFPRNPVVLLEKQNDFAPPFSLRELLAHRKVFFAILLSVASISLLLFLGQTIRQPEQNFAEAALPQIAGKKTLAVMFFENQSKSAELEWLREGLSDMLITNLSRSNRLTVLSRQQFHLLLNRAGHQPGDEIGFENAVEIARKSNAEWFITGSYAQMGEKLRLDVQLCDTQTGGLQTAESLIVEKPEQILTEINLLSIKLAARLETGEPESRTTLTAVMTDNLEAYRNYSLAVEKAQALHNKEALELLEKATVLDPQFAMAHARIGYIYAITWGLPDKAKPHLEKAFQMSDRLTDKDRLNIAAWYAIANLDYPNAIQSFRQIIAQYPTETEAYLRLGNLLKGEEQYDEAINVLRQGLAVDSDSHLLYNALGLLFSSLNRHDEAIAMHRRYVALAPNEANAHDSLGMSYQFAGFYPEAIDEYRRALDINPNFEVALVHLGNAHFQTGRYREAIDLYKKYIEIAPSEYERTRGYNCIARVYLAKKNTETAAESSKPALRKDNFSVWESLMIALERGDAAMTEKLEKRLFSESRATNRGGRILPRYGFYFRGYIALKNGRSEEAIENFKEAIRHLPPTYEMDAMEDCLANAYLEMRQFDEAIAEYKRILNLNPNYPLARFHLARAFAQKGLRTEADESYRNFLQMWKDADADISELAEAGKYLNSL